jgi:hypothetical protein
VTTGRDDFDRHTVDALAKRAAYICSNPDCRAQTIAPSAIDDTKSINIGKAAHIRAASPGGPRFDSSLTPEQRSSIDNGIFLCSGCADMIDKNGGKDYPETLLQLWKAGHEAWVRDNLNKPRKPAVDQPVYNVTSMGQRGGITAGVFHAAPPSRHVVPQLQAELAKALPDKSRTVTITSTLGDSESFAFANEIKAYLGSAGYAIAGVNQGVFSEPLPPLQLDPETLTLLVGSSR